MPQLLDRRNRRGRITSMSQLVPGDASGTLFMRADLSQADLDDPTTSFNLAVEVQQADGSWLFDVGFSFVGGPNQGKGGTPTVAPGIRVNLAEYAGKTVRVVYDSQATNRVGIDLDILSSGT